MIAKKKPAIKKGTKLVCQVCGLSVPLTMIVDVLKPIPSYVVVKR